jgi:hypothetical protein
MTSGKPLGRRTQPTGPDRGRAAPTRPARRPRRHDQPDHRRARHPRKPRLPTTTTSTPVVALPTRRDLLGTPPPRCRGRSPRPPRRLRGQLCVPDPTRRILLRPHGLRTARGSAERSLLRADLERTARTVRPHPRNLYWFEMHARLDKDHGAMLGQYVARAAEDPGGLDGVRTLASELAPRYREIWDGMGAWRAAA